MNSQEYQAYLLREEIQKTRAQIRSSAAGISLGLQGIQNQLSKPVYCSTNVVRGQAFTNCY